jgi:hypothetical protein
MLLLMLWVGYICSWLIWKWKWHVLKCYKTFTNVMVISTKYELNTKVIFPSILLCWTIIFKKKTICVFLKFLWGKPLSLKLIMMDLVDIFREIKHLFLSMIISFSHRLREMLQGSYSVVGHVNFLNHIVII